MRHILVTALRIVSVPLGIGLGFWMAQLTVRCSTFSCPQFAGQPRFAPWLCALFGGVLTVLILLFALAIRRDPSD